jgi:ribonuclease HI
MLFCCYAREVWEIISSEFSLRLCRQQFTSTKVWTLDFLERSSEMQTTAMMVTMWHIWEARNKVQEGETMLHPKSIAEKVLAYIQMIATHLYQTDPTNRRESKSADLQWTPPPEGTVIINVDAAIFKTDRRMGMGAIIRDHNGSCLVACTEQTDEILVPEMAEALAMRRAVILAKDEGYANIIVASDCLSVVNRVTSGLEDRSSCGTVIHDIRRMADSFSSCSFRHVYRGLNAAAHSLAKFSKFSLNSVWRGCAADCIREIICKDIMVK